MDFDRMWTCITSQVDDKNRWSPLCEQRYQPNSPTYTKNHRHHSDSCLASGNSVRCTAKHPETTGATAETCDNDDKHDQRHTDGNFNAYTAGTLCQNIFSADTCISKSWSPTFYRPCETQKHTEYESYNADILECDDNERNIVFGNEPLQFQGAHSFSPSQCWQEVDPQRNSNTDNSLVSDKDQPTLPETFGDDVGSRYNTDWRSFKECGCQTNEWSPFLSDDNRDSDDSLPPSIFQAETFQVGRYYDRRSSNELSEKSCYSTESNVSETEYDFVAFEEIATSECDVFEQKHETSHGERKEDALCMPSSCPCYTLVVSKDGLRTAPNSLTSSQEGYVFVDTDRKNEDGDQSQHTSAATAEYEQAQTACNKCKNGNAVDTVIKSHNSSANGMLAQDVDSLDTNSHKQERGGVHGYKYKRHGNYKTKDSPVKATPPFLSVESIQYEADPKSGKVRSVGKGSFGQVFKARFADPAFHHLSVVVKEFDEDFTSREEIIEEARRLLYLRDTGYVPVCYGLLCLGSSEKPVYGIVQEYIGTGLTLEQLLWEQCELEPYIWIHIGVQCCEGLSKFHAKSILLNDIKSNNIILDFTDHLVRIKYIDFGLATGMRGKRYKNTKSLEEFVYLAPEVRLNGAVTNIASDIFSLGYMLEQISQYSGVKELGYVAGLCMDINPDMRIPVSGASSLLQDHLANIGYHYLPW